MKRMIFAAALCVLALAGCSAPSTGNIAGANTSVTIADQVTLKSTTALSLGELAFTTAEQAATTALNSPSFTKAQKAAIGAAVLKARGYRDQARVAVAAGQDASALLTQMSNAITNIDALATPAQGSN